jgi:hypothetical protein
MATTRNLIIVAASLAAASAASAQTPGTERWWRDVHVLSHDSMKGRQSGTPEHRQAAEYVARAFQSAGLEAGTPAGFLQQVYLTSRRIDESRSSIALVRDGAEEKLTFGEDASYAIRSTYPSAGLTDARLVFAGYGLHLPQLGHDDYAGLDVRNKVVVIMGRPPRGIPGQVLAHARNQTWQMLRKMGAAGMITIGGAMPDTAFVRLQRNRTVAQNAIATEAGGPAFVTLTWNPARADKLFGGAPHQFAAIRAASDSGTALPRFDLPARIRFSGAVHETASVSDNVVGVLRGSDPRLRDEYVVLTAHLDHVGIGRPVNGDSIYNGAMDNAAGTALLMETARRFQEQKLRPKRSIIFLAITAEEHGLLGSKFFADNPTVPIANIVANLNTDMFMPIIPFKMVMVNGLEESNLADDAQRAGTKSGIPVVTDPEPEENRFVRSDQYSFILKGIPALSFKVGFARNTPEHQAVIEFRRRRYHMPDDEVTEHVDLNTVAGFTDFYVNAVQEVANRATRPAWNAKSIFGGK